ITTPVQRVDGYAPIRDYAVIGDGRTCALVGRDGAIDWLPLPDIDSEGVFWRIVDAEKGAAFELQPDERCETDRAYQDGSGDVEVANGAAFGVFDLVAGGETLFDLAVTHREPIVIPGRQGAEQRLARTARFWRDWSSRTRYDGPWRDAVIRSVLALKLLCFA